MFWYAGLGCAGAGLIGPVATAAHTSFAAHMAGHLLLGMIAPLLLVLMIAGGGAAYFLKKRAADQAAGENGEETSAPADAHAADKRDMKHPPTFLPLDPFVVNLADKDADRYAQIGITIEVVDAKFADQMKLFMPAIRNGILMILAHKDSKELLDRNGKEMLAAEILRDLNYQVIEAKDSASALRLLDADKKFDLMLTDVVLPGKNGRELADEVKQLSAVPGVTYGDPVLGEMAKSYEANPSPYLLLTDFRYGSPAGTDLLGTGIQ